VGQIVVLNAGGQYCHLIARRIRELGVHATVADITRPAADLAAARGVIISGGPASVVEPTSPSVDPAIYERGIPILEAVTFGLFAEVQRGATAMIAGTRDACRIDHEAGGPQSLVVTGRAVLRDCRLGFNAGVGRVLWDGSRRLDRGIGRVLREALGMGHEQAPTESRERDAGDETPSRHDAHDIASSRVPKRARRPETLTKYRKT